MQYALACFGVAHLALWALLLAFKKPRHTLGRLLLWGDK